MYQSVHYLVADIYKQKQAQPNRCKHDYWATDYKYTRADMGEAIKVMYGRLSLNAK